eukprot:3659063-Amphidinium_carterae.3
MSCRHVEEHFQELRGVRTDPHHGPTFSCKIRQVTLGQKGRNAARQRSIVPRLAFEHWLSGGGSERTTRSDCDQVGVREDLWQCRHRHQASGNTPEGSRQDEPPQQEAGPGGCRSCTRCEWRRAG